MRIEISVHKTADDSLVPEKSSYNSCKVRFHSSYATSEAKTNNSPKNKGA